VEHVSGQDGPPAASAAGVVQDVSVATLLQSLRPPVRGVVVRPDQLAEVLRPGVAGPGAR